MIRRISSLTRICNFTHLRQCRERRESIVFFSTYIYYIWDVLFSIWSCTLVIFCPLKLSRFFKIFSEKIIEYLNYSLFLFVKWKFLKLSFMVTSSLSPSAVAWRHVTYTMVILNYHVVYWPCFFCSYHSGYIACFPSSFRRWGEFALFLFWSAQKCSVMTILSF